MFFIVSEIKAYFHNAVQLRWMEGVFPGCKVITPRHPCRHLHRVIPCVHLKPGCDPLCGPRSRLSARIKQSCISAEQQTTDGRRASASDPRVSAWLYNGDVRETGACPREASSLADAAFSITLQPAEHVNVHDFSNDAQDVWIHTGRLLQRATTRALAAHFQGRPMH